ncbi:uncharacterized protein G2W53_022283 [Senna tora]|uniref:Uncharacterized protein n=1 Tax=Senna tora TaxID=362788 RepID=A0A834TMQ5_9FABA|nr:uncharacterized protein G2W53_022283 [Senna tora]
MGPKDEPKEGLGGFLEWEEGENSWPKAKHNADSPMGLSIASFSDEFLQSFIDSCRLQSPSKVSLSDLNDANQYVIIRIDAFSYDIGNLDGDAFLIVGAIWSTFAPYVFKPISCQKERKGKPRIDILGGCTRTRCMI